MQLYIITIVAVATLVTFTTSAPANGDRANEYDYEDEPAPVAPAAGRGRLSLLNTRGKSPLRGASAKQPPTPKTTEAPAETEESESLEEDEVPEEDPVTTTTPAPKKSLVRGGVRPFRSNEDLRAALKRRREQMHGGGPKVVQVYPTPATSSPVEENKATRSNSANVNSAINGRRRFTSNKSAPAAAGSSSEPVVAEQPEPTRRTARKFSSRSKPTAAPVDNGDIDEEPAPRPKSPFSRRRS